MTPVEKKILAVALAAIVISTCCIGYVVIKETNKDTQIEDGAHYRISEFKIFDECPYCEKSRDILVKEVGYDQEKAFNPFNPNDYRWVKIVVNYELKNANIWIDDKYKGFCIKFMAEGEGYRRGGMSLPNPGYYTGYEPKQMESYRAGTFEQWYLIPTVAKEGDPGPWKDYMAIPWSEVYMETLKLQVQSDAKLIPMA